MNNNIRKLFFRLLCDKRFMSTAKRRKPIDPEHVKKLPVFQYGVSKNNYRRVFSWGNMQTGALGLPFKHAEESTLKECLFFPKRMGFAEKNEVVTAACGFGFSVFAVRNDKDNKVFGTGINTDSQIGYHEIRQNHPLEVLFYPKPIDLPFKDVQHSKVLKLSAGRAHILVLTNEGIFALGNNAFGQCGRKIIPDENYIRSNYINHIENIDEKKIVDIECGQDHSLALTEDGSVYSCGWGADGQTGLGHYNNCTKFTKVLGEIENEKIVKISSRSDFVLAVNDKGEVFGWGNNEYSQMTLADGSQQVCTPRYIKMLSSLGKIKSVASAGSFCVALNEHGQVFSWGYGLLGAGPKAQESKIPIHIPDVLFGRNDFQPNSTVIDVNCGLFYSTAVTNLGDLYIWGRNKTGCLGLGNDKDQYFPLKVAIGGFVTNVFCGVDHTIAICKPFI